MDKKLPAALVACLLAGFLLTGTLWAAVLGTIPYWESTSNEIGRWKTERRAFNQILGMNGFSSSDFSSYVSHARTQWSNSSISVTQTSSSSNANIKIMGGNYMVLSLQNPNIQSWMAGYAEYVNRAYEGDWTYMGGPKTGYTLSNANCYIIFSAGKSADHYKSVATHELGHAMGWMGHSSNSNHLMYSETNGVTSLTTTDKRHIGQIY